MAEKPFIIPPSQVDSNDIDTIIKSRLNKKAVEKKEEKKLVVNPLDFFRLNPLFSPIANNPNVQEAMDKVEAKSTDDNVISLGKEVEKAIKSGAAAVPYAFGSLLTMGVDYTFDTDFTKKLDDLYNEVKPDEPETFAGELGSLLVEYGLPGTVVTKLVNRGVRLFKTSKAGKLIPKSKVARRVGYGATIVGATDFIVRQPSEETLFLDKVSEEGLSGRELSAARFINKIKFGAEGSLIGGGFPLLGKPLALAFKYGIAKPVVKTGAIGAKAIDTLVLQPASFILSKDKYVLPNVSKLMQTASQTTLERVIAPALVGKAPIKTKLPKFEDWRLFSVDDVDPLKSRLKKLDNFLAAFRSVGKQTGQAYQLTSDAKRYIKGKSRTIEKYLDSIEKRAYNVAKGFEKHYDQTTTSPAGRDYFLDETLQVLKGQKKVTDLPKELQEPVKGLADELKQIRTAFGEALPEGELKNYFLNNTDTYLRKSFAVFTNELYQPPKQVFDDAVEFISKNIVAKNKDLRELALKVGPDLPAEEAYKRSAINMTKDILRSGKLDGYDPLAILNNIAKKKLRMEDITVKTGEELPDVIKKLLGQEDSLRSSVVQTTSSMITQTINKNLYDRLANLGLQQGWLYGSREAADALGVIGTKQISRIPGMQLMGTELEKLYAPAELAQAFRGSKGMLDNAIQSNFYRTLLQLKVGTQFGKTVLSPATQVRNVTSASFFPLANGWVGGKASVSDSFKIVLDDIFGAGKVLNENQLISNIEKKIRLGVLDESIVASELGAVLKDIKKGSINTVDGIFKALTNNKFTKGATRVYAGGDNVWKWYSHEYSKSQLRDVFKGNLNNLKQWTREITGRNYIEKDITGKVKTFDDALDEAAAWYVRNLVPTYSKVPTFVQNIRKLPFGNFVAFPAEIIRTSFNIVNTGMKEISSASPELRQMGYRRLMGAYTVLGGAGLAASKTAMALTGVTEEQVEAYKKNFAASWNAASTLLPITPFEEGKGKFINFSYFSPYEVVQKPIEAALQAVNQQKINPQQTTDYVLSLFAAPIKELVTPFISEAIALERIQDVMPAGFFVGGRGGKTKTGSSVYSNTDSPSDKITKSFGHILQGLEPGAVTTGRKIYRGAIDDIKKGGTPYELTDELLALFSGIRIIDADVSRTMDYKITQFNRNYRDVYKAESFYGLQDWQNRGPEQMANEFRQIQEENFIQQRDFYRTLQAAEKLGLSKSDIRRILKKRKMSKKLRYYLMRGEFTPINYSKDLLKKRVKDAKQLQDRIGGRVNRNYFYPRRELEKVKREYRRKKFDEPVLEKPIVPQQQGILSVPQKVSQVPTRIQTPSLPQQPRPIVQGLPTQISSVTGLTPTESALLSPTEQLIRQRQRT